MKIAAWNINGLRSIINKKGSLDNVLSSLDADIVCLQELRMSNVPFSDSWVSFHASPEVGVNNQSGVATFVRRGHRIPALIGEGDTCAKTLFVRRSLRRSWSHHGDKEDPDIDHMGRCLVTDHKDFVLFNVYIPAGQPKDPAGQSGNLEKFVAKLRFCKALERRVQHFMRAGRRVIIAGDFNISPDPMDDFGVEPGYTKGDRIWLRAFLRQTRFGFFVDSFRECHPEKRSYSLLYTNRQQAVWKRQGFRLDLIIVGSPGLPVRCTEADVLDQLRGSDHFPVCAKFEFMEVDPASPPASTGTTLANQTLHLSGEQGPGAAASTSAAHPLPPNILFQLLPSPPIIPKHAQAHNTAVTKHNSALQHGKPASPPQPTKKPALTQHTLHTWIGKRSGSQNPEAQLLGSTAEPQMTQKSGPESPVPAAEIKPQIAAHDQGVHFPPGTLENVCMLGHAATVPWAEAATVRAAAVQMEPSAVQTEAALVCQTAVGVGSGQSFEAGNPTVQVRSGQSLPARNSTVQVVVEDPAGRGGSRVGVLQKQPTKRSGPKRGLYRKTRERQLQLAKALACKAPEATPKRKPKSKPGEAAPEPTQLLAEFLNLREHSRLPPDLGEPIQSAPPSNQPATSVPASLPLPRVSIPRATSHTDPQGSSYIKTYIGVCACMRASVPPVPAAVYAMSQVLEERLQVPRCAGVFKCQHEGPSQGREYFSCVRGDCCDYFAWVGFSQQGREASRARIPAFLL